MGQIPLRVIQDHLGKKTGGPGAINPISSISPNEYLVPIL